MKVLFGIQGTGNGHISRSRELLRYLSKRASVDILLSGYHHEVDIGFEVKYNLPGLGFTFGKRGGIDYVHSLRNFSPGKLLSDIYGLPVEKYDLVLTDFEPVTAWAARIKRRPIVAISHQAAFLSPKIPRPPEGRNRFQEKVLEWYAPAPVSIGLHFERYDDFIFTPIIREEIRKQDPRNDGHYTVYLPSYDYARISGILKKIDVRWEVFSKHHKGEAFKDGNVTVYPVGNDGFARSLVTCEGILCNAGFETPAEALYLGKKIMVIPMKGQYEQQCNAEALGRMGVPVIRRVDAGFVDMLSGWVSSGYSYKPDYTNNLPEIVDRILENGSGVGRAPELSSKRSLGEDTSPLSQPE